MYFFLEILMMEKYEIEIGKTKAIFYIWFLISKPFAYVTCNKNHHWLEH